MLREHYHLPCEIVGDLDSEQPGGRTQVSEFIFLIHLDLEFADELLRASSHQAVINVDSQDDDSPVRPLLNEGSMVGFRAVESQLSECFLLDL